MTPRPVGLRALDVETPYELNYSRFRYSKIKHIQNYFWQYTFSTTLDIIPNKSKELNAIKIWTYNPLVYVIVCVWRMIQQYLLNDKQLNDLVTNWRVQKFE